MTFSLQSLIRMTMLLVVGSTILAVSISRLDPPQQVRRYARPSTSVSVSDFLLAGSDREQRWINPETGEFKVIPVQVDGILEAASCSPWVDDSGKRQIVGRWSSRQNQGPKAISTAFGLGRYSFPDGELIDQINCETVPVHAPCWYPGTQARILFSGGDGELHQFAFESLGTSETESAIGQPVESEPTTLTWSCPKPGSGKVFIGETTWPTDPRLGGRLIVSMRIQERTGSGHLEFSRSELWWMKLDVAGTRIIDVGPLINHDVSRDEIIDFEERWPVISGLPDGSLALAYAHQADQRQGLSFHLGKVRISERGELVPVRESEMRQLSALSQPTSPSFSADGRWISILIEKKEGAGSVVRVPTMESPANLTITVANPAVSPSTQVR